MARNEARRVEGTSKKRCDLGHLHPPCVFHRFHGDEVVVDVADATDALA